MNFDNLRALFRLDPLVPNKPVAADPASSDDNNPEPVPVTDSTKSATNPMITQASILHYDADQCAAGERRLEELLQKFDGVYGAIVSSIDGNYVLASLKREMPVATLSNMTSSLLALGESIARESSQRLCQFVILENSDGRVVSLRINEVLMLTCISNKKINLGMLLSAGRTAADMLAQLLHKV